MSLRILLGCDGCGMCARACPRGVIVAKPDEAVPYAVVALDCNDCQKCVVVCPLHVIELDPAWAECWSRGCPLTSRRYAGWACNEGRVRCPTCGSPLWKTPNERRWTCVRCTNGSRVGCPKARRAAVTTPVA